MSRNNSISESAGSADSVAVTVAVAGEKAFDSARDVARALERRAKETAEFARLWARELASPERLSLTLPQGLPQTLSRQIETRLPAGFREAVRASAQRVQTEIDRALLGLHHAGAAQLLERLSSPVRAIGVGESADDPGAFAVRLGRNVLARAQEFSASLAALRESALSVRAADRASSAPAGASPEAQPAVSPDGAPADSVDRKPNASTSSAAVADLVTERDPVQAELPIAQAVAPAPRVRSKKAASRAKPERTDSPKTGAKSLAKTAAKGAPAPRARKKSSGENRRPHA